MSENIQLIIHDFFESFKGIRLVEYAKLAFLTLWVFILMMPIGDADRRDVVACLVYTLFISFAAATLMFALPSTLVSDDSSFNDQFMTIMILTAVATIRWGWSYNEYSEIRKSRLDESEEELGGPNGKAKK